MSARPDWMTRARCASADDPDVFFPTTSQSSEPARARCQSCEVLTQCRAWGIEHHHEDGVWGGLTHSERQIAAGVRPPESKTYTTRDIMAITGLTRGVVRHRVRTLGLTTVGRRGPEGLYALNAALLAPSRTVKR